MPARDKKNPAVVNTGCKRVDIFPVVEPRLADELIVFLSFRRFGPGQQAHHSGTPQQRKIREHYSRIAARQQVDQIGIRSHESVPVGVDPEQNCRDYRPQ